jgi:methyl-accepting chemotaxis protein
MNPKLKVESITIFAQGATVYTQKFNDGLNVFAGDNSTGKSTIIEFIVYCLGYEEIVWREEQKRCDLAELVVLVSGKRLRLRREINSFPQNPLYIKDFDSEGGWTVLPYRNSANKKSFSAHLFEILGFPLGKNEQDSALTMFQIFRLIYADQNTSPDSLFNRQKDMDTKGNRKSIYEFVIGADDLEMHELRQKLITTDKLFSKTNAEISAIQDFVSNLGHDLTHIGISEALRIREERIEQLKKQLDIAQNSDPESDDALSRASIEMDELRQKRQRLNRDIWSLQTEIEDSEELLKLLESSTNEIDASLAFYSVFSGIKFSYCPQCLGKLNFNHVHDSDCELCGSEASKTDEVKSFYFDRKKEIEFQISESKGIIERKRKAVEQGIQTVKDIENSIQSLKARIGLFARMTSEQTRTITEISIQIGSTLEEIASVNKSKDMLSSIDTKKAAATKLKEICAQYRSKIEQLCKDNESYQTVFARNLSDTIVNLIKVDGGFESSFKTASKAMVIYDESKMVVDGATKFAASSDAVLKIAVRFALIYLSIKNHRMRIPKFGIIDCMEDKGMQPDRVHAIQDGILDMLDEVDQSDYQIFFATSMPSKRIIEGGFVIDKYYEKGMHTLQF